MARFLKLYPYAELLEHPRLPAGQAKDIATYLLTLSDLPGGIQISGHKVTKKTLLSTPLKKQLIATKIEFLKLLKVGCC
jgi:hypothetical protein